MNFNDNKFGFTLIEVVISLAILTIIVTAFLSLFSAGLLGIYAAGDKGLAYSDAQADLESRIGSREALTADDLILVFDGDSHSIQGGLVESFQSVGSRNSSLETFIPMVPTILINPSVKLEGYQEPLTIEIIGLNTNFNSTYTTVDIYDKHGATKLFGPLTVSVSSPTEATFTMPENLINSAGYYIVRLTTLIPGEPAEICRAKYLVDQPGFIAAGENILYVTENSTSWYDRPSSTLDSFPSFSDLNAICFGFNRYLTVGSGGQILYSTDQSSWTKVTAGASDLNGVAFSGTLGKFYTVGSYGSLIYSTNGTIWTAIYLDTTKSLNGIAITGDGFITAVGDDGLIITSSGGTGWNYYPNTVADNLNDIATNYVPAGLNNHFIVVGDNGTIVTSTDGSNWSFSPVSGISDNLNSISHQNDLFVAVGDNGRIIAFNVLNNTWSALLVGAENLNGIYGSGGLFVAVGDNGTILTSTDAVNWTSYSNAINSNFNAVAGK